MRPVCHRFQSKMTRLPSSNLPPCDFTACTLRYKGGALRSASPHGVPYGMHVTFHHPFNKEVHPGILCDFVMLSQTRCYTIPKPFFVSYTCRKVTGVHEWDHEGRANPHHKIPTNGTFQ